MRLALVGATGFLGRSLAASLAADGHDLVLFSRRPAAVVAPPRARAVAWPGSQARPESLAAEIGGADVVINLAGESLDARRWTDRQKERLLDSRIGTTRLLARAIARVHRPPRLLVNMSAVGYYGPHGDEVLTESAPAGAGFLARLCAAWEAEAVAAAGERTRVALVRSGVVLDRGGGALDRMLLPFRLGLGGPLGGGRQYWSWIHRADWVRFVRWMITLPDGSGPFNATAPTPVTSAELARALGRALHRPAILPAPAFALRLVFGEMADAMLLTGQRVVPDRALRLGFDFRYPDIDTALRSLFASQA